MLVLIADDCEDTCEVLSAFLRMEQHKVDYALTSHHALELAVAQRYDIILMVLWLPEVDGYSLAKPMRSLRAHESHPRIIELSGAPYDPSHPCAQAAAFDGFVGKPVDMIVLGQALSSLPLGWVSSERYINP